MDNLVKFNILVGCLFSDLYKSFPVPLEFENGYRLSDVISEDDDFDGAFNYDQLLFHACSWLEKSNYIYLETEAYTSGECEYKATLTEKGFEVLNTVPESLDSTETLGEKIAESVKDKAIDSLINFTAVSLSTGFGLILKGS